MQHLFVPYQEAYELKQLGFDEPCLGFSSSIHPEKIDLDNNCFLSFYKLTNKNIDSDVFITRPTYQQVFDWFREKHSLYSYIEPVIVEHAVSPIKFDYVILELDIENEIIFDTLPFHSNQEAQLACLQKLIEIVKTKINI